MQGDHKGFLTLQQHLRAWVARPYENLELVAISVITGRANMEFAPTKIKNSQGVL